jgi:micrococcal nuclease
MLLDCNIYKVRHKISKMGNCINSDNVTKSSSKITQNQRPAVEVSYSNVPLNESSPKTTTPKSSKTLPASKALASSDEDSRREINRGCEGELVRLDLTTVKKKGLISGRYIGRLMRVYDGDTMTVAVSMDGRTYWAHQIRLYGCDAPEAKGSTKTAAMKAKEEVLRFVKADGAIGRKNGKDMNTWFQTNPTLITVEFMSELLGQVDKYGRDLAKIWVTGRTIDLSTHLINNGLAYQYDGGTKDQSQYEEV